MSYDKRSASISTFVSLVQHNIIMQYLLLVTVFHRLSYQIVAQYCITKFLGQKVLTVFKRGYQLFWISQEGLITMNT
jgi:hypothetical protein